MATKRIYIVKQSVTTDVSSSGVIEHLVRASSAAQAIGHVVKPRFTAEVASQDVVLRLAKTHDVHEAGE